MDINLWANKTVLDWLLAWDRPIRQIVAVSSGAAVLGNRGWGGYALSKAALNMLIKLYAHEFRSTHLNAVAPGLIETAMMDALFAVEERDQFPALRRIHAARGTERMLTPRSAGERLLKALPQLLETESGSYIDVRTLLAPEEYQELLAASTAARNVS
jgi:NAD(P)-dependent dehydrogenase (short-subunit alcohol dehydrogenase family)